MSGPARRLTLLTRITAPATDRVTLVGFQLGWQIVRHLPEPAAYRLFETLADVLVRRDGKGVRRLRSNYARVRPELDRQGLQELVRDGMRSYMRYYCEAFRLPDFSRARLASLVTIHDEAPARQALADGRSVVVFLGHFGNWDLAGAWSTLYLAPVTTVAERLEPEQLFQEFVGFRESLGMTILPLTGGPDPFAALRRAAEGGALVALLADRDLTRGGVEVDFFGRRARMAKGPAVLSMLTGAPLFAAAIHYEPAPDGAGVGGRRLVVRFSPQVERPAGMPSADAAVAMVQQCAGFLEGHIREHTEDWHMLQRVFVEDLDPARTAPA